MPARWRRGAAGDCPQDPAVPNPDAPLAGAGDRLLHRYGHDGHLSHACHGARAVREKGPISGIVSKHHFRQVRRITMT